MRRFHSLIARLLSPGRVFPNKTRRPSKPSLRVDQLENRVLLSTAACTSPTVNLFEQAIPLAGRGGAFARAVVRIDPGEAKMYTFRIDKPQRLKLQWLGRPSFAPGVYVRIFDANRNEIVRNIPETGPYEPVLIPKQGSTQFYVAISRDLPPNYQPARYCPVSAEGDTIVRTFRVVRAPNRFDFSVHVDTPYSSLNAVLYRVGHDVVRRLWGRVFLGDLPDVRTSRYYDYIDDVRMYLKLSAASPDGVGGVLIDGAFATRRGGRLGTPYEIQLVLDPADIVPLAQRALRSRRDYNYLFNIVSHGIGHAMGLGSDWAIRGLIRYDGPPLRRYEYIGRLGLLQYRRIFRKWPATLRVDRAIYAPRPFENQDYYHWAPRALPRYELMAGNLRRGQPIRKLSSVSLRALQDLGYRINPKFLRQAIKMDKAYVRRAARSNAAHVATLAVSAVDSAIADLLKDTSERRGA